MKFAQEVLDGYYILIKRYIDHDKVKRRISSNIHDSTLDITKDKFWRFLLLGVITSGKSEVAVEKIKSLSIFDFYTVSQQEDRLSFFVENLSSLGCQNKFARYMDYNYIKIVKEWESIFKKFESIKQDPSLEKERCAVLNFQEFMGIGPKQSRNILQMLGLSKYVVPIDSRIKKALKKLGGVNLPESKKAFNDEKSYREIEDQFIGLCCQLEITPCILEACLFQAFKE